MNATLLARNIGRKVRERRKDAGLTQKQLAKSTGVSERLIRALEAGDARGIGLENLAAVLSPLGLDLRLTENGEVGEIAYEVTTINDDYEDLLQRAVASWTNRDANHGR